MHVIAYSPRGKIRRINIEWLYGLDIIDALSKEFDIEILDGSSDMEEVYKRADVYIRPTRHDGMSIMILECVSRGIPYIWSYETGKYVEPTVEYFRNRLNSIRNKLKNT